MACVIEEFDNGNGACFRCTTAEVVFGPVMDDAILAEHFEDSLAQDPRRYTVDDLMELWERFRQRAEECSSCGGWKIDGVCPLCGEDD